MNKLPLVVASIVIAFSGSASAQDVEDFTITEGQTVEKDYGPIPSQTTGQTTGSAQCKTPDQFQPQSIFTCDAIDVTVDVSSRYTANDLWRVEYELSWANSAVNNLNLFLYDSKDTEVNKSSTANHPEKMIQNEPHGGKYVLVVFNQSGSNSGYHVKAHFSYGGKRPPPAPDDDAPAVASRNNPRNTGSTSLETAELTAPVSPGEASPESVQAAGPDGPLFDSVLSQMGRPSVESQSATAILAIVLALVVIVGGTAFLLVRRRRQDLMEP